MRLHLIKLSFLLLSLDLAACTTDTGAPEAASGAVATGAALARPTWLNTAGARRPASMVPPPGNISTQDPVPRSFGSLVVGTADTGVKTYSFNCRFELKRQFYRHQRDVAEGVWLP